MLVWFFSFSAKQVFFVHLVYKTHMVFDRDQILDSGEGLQLSGSLNPWETLSLCSFSHIQKSRPAHGNEDQLQNALKSTKKWSRLANFHQWRKQHWIAISEENTFSLKESRNKPGRSASPEPPIWGASRPMNIGMGNTIVHPLLSTPIDSFCVRKFFLKSHWNPLCYCFKLISSFALHNGGICLS